MDSSLPLEFPLVRDGPGPYRVLLAGRRRLVRRFREQLQDPGAAQRERLQVIMELVGDSAFGREHGLSRVRSLDELRRAVPIRSHSELAPWLDRVARGEPGVLTSVPVTGLVETSGTTGRSKRLPVTRPWAEAVAAAQTLWLLGLVREHPGVHRGKALTVVSSAERGRSEGGLPVGSNTGRMHAAQPWFVRLRYPVPAGVFALAAPSQRLYALLRFALPADIRSLTTANPSTVLLMARKLREWREPLSLDLRAGTLRHGPASTLPARTRRHLELLLRRSRPPGGPWTLPALWPSLEVVNCWTAGPAAWFAERLRAQLGPAVTVRPLGLTASEGYFALPLAGRWPGGVLLVGGHLLELIGEDEQPRWPWQVQQGEVLRLVISTEAGLLRYDLGDRVEVVGRCEQTPVVRFVGKAGRFLNAVGERVSEAQLSAAVASAGRACAAQPTGLTARVRLAEVPAYEIAVEGLDADEAARFARALDRALGEHNLEYAGRRSSERLGPPRCRLLPAGSYARWRAARLAAGAPDTQLKDPLLALDEAEWAAVVGA